MQTKDYHRIVVLGDPHLPGNSPEAKKEALRTINDWQDVDLVVAVGDICQFWGSTEELDFARSFFQELRHPLALITGNHDCLFDDSISGFLLPLFPARMRHQKLVRFKTVFQLEHWYFFRELGGYKLLFISVDDLEGDYFAAMSKEVLTWLDKELSLSAHLPSILFFHAPLWPEEILSSYPALGNYIAQPHRQIREILSKHPQLFMWVSGHNHLGPFNPYGYGELNFFENRIHVINNCDMDGNSVLSGSKIRLQAHENIWTRSLFLFSNQVVVKTFDHNSGIWLSEIEKIYPTPK